MKEIEQNNPAGRLHAILSAAIQEIEVKRNNVTAVNLWASVFEIPIDGPIIYEQSLLEIISRILQLDRLIDDAETGLMKIEGLHERYFRPFARLRAVPRQSLVGLTSDISGQIKAISEGDMTVLEFCAEKLEAQHAEVVISDNDLQEVLQEVNLLFDQVKTAQMDEGLQAFILDGLESIRRGIYEFRIRGSERLKETLGEIVGSLYVNYKTVQAAGDDESLEKFNKLFNRLSAMVTFASSSMKLLNAFATPLLPG